MVAKKIGEEEETYIAPLPYFPDLKHAKLAREKDSSPPGINHYHTTFLLFVQILLCILYGLTVQQDKFPKQQLPDPGSLENPNRIDEVPPFKRYPPGFDIFLGTARINEFKVQEHYSSFMQISIFVFVGLPWSFSFLRRYAYSAVGFGLVSACVATQIGIVSMQVVDRVHCSYLKDMLRAPDFSLNKIPLTPCPDYAGPNSGGLPCRESFVYTCKWTSPTQRWTAPPLDEIQDDFGARQLRQACYCDLWDRIVQNKTLAILQPRLAHQALLVTGHQDFNKISFSLSFMNVIDGIYATVPVMISFGVVLGKMTPIQLVPFGILNVVAYAFNLWVCTYVIGAWDHTGGCCVNHIFGACFGIAAAAISYTKGCETSENCRSRYHMDILSLFGTMLLWVTYPSYNNFYAPSFAQKAVAVNTFLAVLASAVASLLYSALFHPKFKLTITDTQRSVIAGGVAMSSNANLVSDPWVALLIGGLGGMACCFGVHKARRFWQQNLQTHDTVGVTSMHLYPGIIGWLAGIILFSPNWPGFLNQNAIYGDLQSSRYKYHLQLDQILNHNRGTGDAMRAQIYIGPMSVATGLVTGTIAGLIAIKIKRLEFKSMYLDDYFFSVPDDFYTTKVEKSGEDAIDDGTVEV
uniref:Ammonium transporter AmtB-like domain-containing protein n=1 Tax=Hanusia phi TaxID=3032 RepID=A0A7S0F3Q8_9CRYP|mmetsp:Transcript_4244/g.10300  ORF Transcript_4244/g.10300 Transcript_4244/m.10300 type:complete len:634 (+) Transcript_4244:97-1998(+)